MSIKLLILAFEKAEKEIGSIKKTHLAQHLSDLLQEDYEYSISERTLRDYYTNYKNDTIGKQEDLKPKLIACLCDYLGYKNYADFINQNQGERIGNPDENQERLRKTKEKGEEEKKNGRRMLIISIGISFGALLLTVLALKYPMSFDSKPAECMTWADSLYVKVSCDKGPFSQFGTTVDSLDQMKLEKMRKVKVHAAYQFFSDTGEPLIWYYKKNNKEIEYFTAPGLHPTNRATLRKITPYIIQTYVPEHMNKKSSFVPE
ncbi:MAG: hypothetical protein AAGB24_01865 [Bacteroidota bacterium]